MSLDELRHIKTSLNPGLSVDCMSRARAIVATLARSAVLLAVPVAGLADLRGKKARGGDEAETTGWYPKPLAAKVTTAGSAGE